MIDPDWLQLAVAIIAVAATYVALKTLQVLEKQTDIAKANTHALVSIERAWLRFDGIRVDRLIASDPQCKIPIHIHFKFRNFGHTPAWIIGNAFRFIKLETTEIEKLDYAEQVFSKHPMGMPPRGRTEEISVLLEPPPLLSSQDVADVISKRAFLYFYGYIRYCDKLEMPDAIHESRFCFRMDISVGWGGELLIDQERCGPAGGNEYT